MRFVPTLAALVLAAMPISAAAEGPEPGYFRVTGVAPDDVLNIRAAPRASAEIVSTLAPGAAPVEILYRDAGGNWGLVPLGERDGWVSMRFLEPIEPERIGGTRLPVGLVCLGTEPFWAFTLTGQGTAEFSSPEFSVPLTLRIVSTGTVEEYGDRIFTLRSVAQGEDIMLRARFAQCNDGMSDRSFGISVGLDLGTGPIPGCCTLR